MESILKKLAQQVRIFLRAEGASVATQNSPAIAKLTAKQMPKPSMHNTMFKEIFGEEAPSWWCYSPVKY